MAENTKPSSKTEPAKDKPNVQVQRADVAPDGTVKLDELRKDISSVEIADVDLLVRFADGSNLLIPNGAIDALSATPPKVLFKDSQTTAADLMKLAGKAAPVTAGNVRIITDQLDTRNTDAEVRENVDVAPSDTPIQPPPAPMTPVKTGTSTLGFHKGGGSGPGEVPDVVLTPQTIVPAVVRSGQRIEDIAKLLDAGVPDVAASLYVAQEFKVTPSPAGVPMGARDSAATIDQQNQATLPAAQANIEHVMGTGGADTFNYNTALAPDDVAKPYGIGAKDFFIHFSSFYSLTSVTIFIQNTPFNLRLDPAVATATAAPTGTYYTLNLTPTMLTDGVDLKLYYDLANGAVGPNDYPSYVVLLQATGLASPTLPPFEINKTFNFIYKDASTAADFTAADGSPILVLPAHGLGYVLDGQGGNDEIHAGPGADTIYGGSGDDSLYGDAGNDIILGGTGKDFIDGGKGTNTASYENATGPVTVSLQAGAPINGVSFTAAVGGGVTSSDGTGGDAGAAGEANGDTLKNIQNIIGSGFNDYLIGDANANALNGGAGDDTLEGGAGADTLYGGSGSNTASFAHSAQGVFATMTPSVSVTWPTTDATGDIFYDIHNLIGSTHADYLVGSSDVAVGDILTGFGSIEAGGDTLEGMAGADTLAGTAGVPDTASYAHASAGVTMSLINHEVDAGFVPIAADVSRDWISPAAQISPSGDAAGDAFYSIENVIGSGFNDVIIGSDVANSLAGAAGNDTLEGLGGADTLDGGTGTNTASYAHDASGVVANLHANGGNVILVRSWGGLVATNDAAGDVYAKDGSNHATIQNLLGSSHADVLIGDDSDNVLTGNGGGDTLEGLAGSDTLTGSVSAIDTASYAHATNRTVVQLDTRNLSNVIVGGDAQGDVYISIENLLGSGFGGDQLIGNANDNQISGGGASGGLGDTLEGLEGADTLVGNAGVSDTASYEHAAAVDGLNQGVTVSLINHEQGVAADVSRDWLSGGQQVSPTGPADGDVFDSIENLTGSAYNDLLIGDDNANSLAGGSGNDTLEGLDGNDTLDGGLGNNTASYAHAAAGVFASIADPSGNTGDAAGDAYVNIQNLLGSLNDDTLVGSGTNNLLTGNGGNNDVLEGLAGADTLDGSGGNNVTASYAHGTAAVTASLLDIWASGGYNLSANVSISGDARGSGLNGAGHPNTDVYINIKNLEGTVFSDLLIGDTNANTLTGGGGNDTLEGLAGADQLIGSVGNNVTASYSHAQTGVVVNLYSNGGYQDGGIDRSAVSPNGVAEGNAASDAFGDQFTDITNLTGSRFADTLIGDDNSNTLIGGGGGDLLEGLGGADSLVGSAAAIDTASYAHANGGLTASLNSAYAVLATGDAAGDRYSSIENLIGSTYDDSLIGDTGNNSIVGNGGQDTIDGGLGNDTLVAAPGSDSTLSYTTIPSGGAGVQISLLNQGSAQNTGGAGIDLVSGFANLIGSANNDTLTGDAAANRIDGGSGDDTIDGVGGNDTLLGGGSGAHGDTLSYASLGVGAGVTVSLQAQSPVVAQATGVGAQIINGFQHLVGSQNADSLLGDASANSISGGAGNDTIDGGVGSAVDTLTGGGDTDTLSYASASGGVTVLLNLTTGDTVSGAAGADVISGFTNLIGSDFADSLLGNTNANTINGGLGDDTIDGGAGNVVDNLAGGIGTDTLSYASIASGGVTVDLVASTVTSTSAGNDIISGFENVIGSGGNDSILGDGTANTLVGGSGNDTIDGGTGNVVDSLDGGLGNDTLSYASVATGGVNINLATSTVTSATAGNDVITGFENVIGSGGDDSLFGSSAANTMAGGDGDDTIDGGTGNVADNLDGGLGTDTLSYASANGGVTVNLNVSVQATVSAGNDTIAGFENLIGSAFDDSLLGDGNANSIVGSTGNDTIDGGAGNVVDTLDGGIGNDTLSYASVASGGVTVDLVASTVTSASAGNDIISSFENVIGSGGDDSLLGDGTSNNLNGGNGNDTIDGGIGNIVDTLTGGGGNDTLSYASILGGAITVDLSSNLVSGSAGADVISGFENLIGSAGTDSLLGDSAANSIDGGVGDDTIDGGVGTANDSLTGGGGTDTVSYAGLAVGAGVNVSLAAQGAAQNTGAAGNDLLVGFANLIGSQNADTLLGDTNSNSISGGLGNDLVDGGDDATGTVSDTLVGGGGNDTVTYASLTHGVGVNVSLASQGSNQTTGGAGTDLLVGFTNLTGSAYADTLSGDTNANNINGGTGDDLIDGGDYISGATVETLSGGGGVDTLTYASLTHGVGVNVSLASQGGNQATGGAGTQLLTGFTNLLGSSYADTLTGDANVAGNSINGGLGNDVIDGGAGVLGVDSLVGGGGIDTVSYASLAVGAGVTVSLALQGSNQATGGAGTDLLTGFTNLTGSQNADTLTGDSGANTIDGGAGDDLLEGLAGADAFIGGSNTSTLTGGGDTVTYANSTSGVVASLTNGLVSETNDALGDTFSGVEKLIGTIFADTLIGDGGNNTITGNGGGDELEGMAGADSLVGTVGVTDTASYAHAGAAVRASLAASPSVANSGDAAGDVFTSIENLRGSGNNDTLSGNSNASVNMILAGDGNDIIYGVDAATAAAVLVTNGGNDTLNGENGDDTVYGGGGSDSILGGAGNDTIYLSLGADTIDGGTGNDTLNVTTLASADYRMLSINFPQGAVSVVQISTGVTQSNVPSITSIETVIGTSLIENYFLDLGGRTLATGGGNDNISYYWWQQGTLVSGQYLGVRIDATTGAATLQNTGITYTWTQDNFDVALAGTNRNYQGTLNGDDWITGGIGNDTLTGYFGQDTLDGGAGTQNVWNMSTNGAAAPAGATAALFGGVVQTYVLGSLTPIATVNATGTIGGTPFDFVTGYTLTGNNTYVDGSGNVQSITLTGLPAAIDPGITNDILRNLQYVVGTSNNDWIIGDAGANSINGGAGNDVLEGLVGADTLDGGNSGTDTATYAHSAAAVVASLTTGTYAGVTFTGSATSVRNTGTVAQAGDAGGAGGVGDLLNYISNLIGSNYDDVLVGNASANYLIGGAGNDTLQGLAGADTFEGGTGVNTVSYQNSTLGVTANLLTPASNTNDAAGDSYSNIQNLIGSAQADVLTGDGNNNTIEGLAGNDILNGGVGGTDTVSYATATAAVTVNLAAGTATGTTVGTDTLTNFQNILGGLANDVLTGSSVSNSIVGGTGADTIDGGTGAVNDTLDGGVLAEINTVTYASLNGGVGVTVSLALQGGSQNTGGGGSDLLRNFSNLVGSGYNDTLTDDVNANSIDGGAGNDILVATGDAANDTFNGNAGTDTMRYSGVAGPVTISLNAAGNGTATGAAIGTDTLQGIEVLIGTSGNDTLTGNNLTYGTANASFVSYANAAVTGVNLTLANGAGTATASGGAGADSITQFLNVIGSTLADTIVGNTSNNYIEGGTGNDSLDGGLGSDWVSYANATGAVTVSLTSNTATGTDGSDTLANFENILGSANNDVLTGNAGANSIDGGNGNDTIEGAIGASAGVDTLNGNTGTDTISYANLTGSGVTVTLVAGNGTGVRGGVTDVLTAFENITGSAQADVLTGDANANTISGGDGNDTIDGGAANDSLLGGNGNDLILATQGADTVDGGAGSDTVQITATVGPTYLINGNSAADAGVDSIVVNGLGASYLISNLTGVASSSYSAASRVLNFEQLGIRDSINTAVTFTAYDVRNVTGVNGAGASLNVFTDAGDTLVLGAGTTEGHSSSAVSVSFNSNTYTTDTTYTLTTGGNTAVIHWYT